MWTGTSGLELFYSAPALWCWSLGPSPQVQVCLRELGQKLGQRLCRGCAAKCL